MALRAAAIGKRGGGVPLVSEHVDPTVEEKAHTLACEEPTLAAGTFGADARAERAPLLDHTVPGHTGSVRITVQCPTHDPS